MKLPREFGLLNGLHPPLTSPSFSLAVIYHFFFSPRPPGFFRIIKKSKQAPLVPLSVSLSAPSPRMNVSFLFSFFFPPGPLYQLDSFPFYKVSADADWNTLRQLSQIKLRVSIFSSLARIAERGIHNARCFYLRYSFGHNRNATCYASLNAHRLCSYLPAPPPSFSFFLRLI